MKITFLLYILCFSFVFGNECLMQNFDVEVINIGSTISEVEQRALTSQQCEIYRKELKSRLKFQKATISSEKFNRATVLCGKWMFINLGIKTKIGIPLKILKMIEEFPEVGPKLKNLGFPADESTSQRRWPFGIADSKHQNPLSFKRLQINKVKQISCAGCHSGFMPDGRFSLGFPNEKLNYGKFNIYFLYTIWLTDKKKYHTKRYLPELIQMFKGFQKIPKKGKFEKTLLKVATMPGNGFILKHFIGEEPPPLETQKSFLYSMDGVYNGFAPSLNFNQIRFYTTIPQLWEMDIQHESHFGSLAGLTNLDDFIGEAIVYSARSKKYIKREYLEPVREFLKCLKAPKNKKSLKQKIFAKGEALFKRNCISCHNLKNGGGSLGVSPEKVNFPTMYLGILDKYKATDMQSKKTYKLLQHFNFNSSSSNVKVRRLKGIWSRTILSTNGLHGDLESLFCLSNQSNQKKNLTHVLNYFKGETIHDDLCEKYSKEDKLSIIEYLNFF